MIENNWYVHVPYNFVLSVVNNCGRIILNWIVREWCVRVLMEFIWLIIGYGNKSLISIEAR